MMITCQGFESGVAFKQYVEKSLQGILDKYSVNFDSLHIHAARAPLGFQVQIKLHIPKQAPLQTEGGSKTIHRAFDCALSRLGKRVRRFKRYRDDYQRGHTSH